MDKSKDRIRIIVCGAGGRMGGRIIHAILQNPDLDLAAGVEMPGHPILEKGMGQYIGIPDLSAPVASDLNEVIDRSDMIIDFTSPDAGIAHLKIAREKGKGLVTGTTGFDEKQKERFKEAGRDIPICLSPNMSIGVNVLFSIVGKVAGILGESYDPEIVEIHHRLKKDAPSGTAMQLARILSEARGWALEKTGVYGRQGMVGQRKTDEIGIHAVRTGDVVGEHTVIFGGPGERIELTHRAHSRDTFAFGAVKAALFIAEAGPGLYNMQDVLGLRV
ncbi:4-hydroxy-tetrahydrodipicolinate reductase [bacterium]|nr:4-hydroxy-tetrahydrodipicolinate reductase [bacterium]